MSQGWRGEVWLVLLGKPLGHEQAGARPAVMLQTDDLRHLSTAVIVPLTSQQKRAGFANTVFLPEGEAGLDQPSVALCHQICVLDRRKLVRKLGELTAEKVSEIEAAVSFVLGLPT